MITNRVGHDKALTLVTSVINSWLYWARGVFIVWWSPGSQ